MAAAITEAMAVWAPPPKLTVSEWADQNRILSPETSAEPGKWNTARAEYLRGFMDAANEPETETVVAMFASQTGKTSAIENVIGYHVDQDPSPILMVVPTLDLAEVFSKDRLAPMIRDTKVLNGKIADARARDSDNTLLHKRFAGGQLGLAGANSPASLASRPIRILIGDEIDRYPPSAGTEGDPVSLARKRTTNFWNRKIFLISSPTIKTMSRIETAYEESDQRRYWVPCPHCQEPQTLKWKQVRWPTGKPETAQYMCPHCGALWSDSERWRAIEKGEWRAERPFNGTAGFHLNGIYSPWIELGVAACDFLNAKPHPERLKVWVNTFLAETWEEDAEKLDPQVLAGRLENWKKPPVEIMVITAGVDLQDDRVEVELVGWGPGEESWSLEHKVIYGDPSAPFLWQQLDECLLQRFRIVDGRELPISAVCVDTGGHYTQAAYSFCKMRWNRRVYAIKGKAGAGHPVWPKRASKNNKARVNLFLIGVDAAKDMVIARLKVAEPGPGYCHFPADRDAEYFRQLTAEKVVRKYVKGFETRIYEKDPNSRNEALDMRVYAYAALMALNVSWGRVQAAAAEAQVAQKNLFSERKPPPEYNVPIGVLQPSGPAASGAQTSTRPVSRSNWMTR
jgi:phage terminase large subunit GpA-like protein